MSVREYHCAPSDSPMSDDAVEQSVGLPTGTLRSAQQWAHQITTGLSTSIGQPVTLCPVSLRARILAAPLTGVVPHNPPIPVGDGWVHADLGPDDHDLFWALHQRCGADGPEVLSQAAQDCRVAVTPYRTPTMSGAGPQSWIGDLPYGEVRGRKVLDLSTMWAGPLAARWLAQLGAEVRRVEPSCRPDGVRQTPRLFASLHPEDAALDLDLRRTADRCVFEELLAETDLLIESFSSRVLANLGYSPDDITTHHPGVQIISIRAYSETRHEARWSGYGGGVHATSGLGMDQGQPRPAGYAYLDPLTALRAVDVALTAQPGHQVVALSDTAEVLRTRGVLPAETSQVRRMSGRITKFAAYVDRCPFVVRAS